MDNYKERYEQLEKSVLEIKCVKQKLEQLLMEKKNELEKEKKLTEEIEIKLSKLEETQNKVLSKGEKLINAVIDTIKSILIMGTPAAFITLYFVISPAKIFERILLGTTLLYGNIVFLTVGLFLTNKMEHILKKNNLEKNKNKKQYLEITKKINESEKDYDRQKHKQNQIEEEIKSLLVDINNEQVLLSSKESEMIKLLEEIIKNTIDLDFSLEDTVQISNENDTQTNTKPKIKLRKIENR